MPIKVTYQNPGLEYDENMVCEDFLNMGMLPLEFKGSSSVGGTNAHQKPGMGIHLTGAKRRAWMGCWGLLGSLLIVSLW